MKFLPYLLALGLLVGCAAHVPSTADDANPADSSSDAPADTDGSADDAAAGIDIFPLIGLQQLQDLVGGDYEEMVYELGEPHANFESAVSVQQIYVLAAESDDDGVTLGDISCEVSVEFDGDDIIVDYSYTGEGCDHLIDFDN
ncbi:MAG: hypothetical protein K0U36_00570 [Alphaproteobacteria bacterium]|nr:hypothetical protein [Alphaproteobacteria bacterium]